MNKMQHKIPQIISQFSCPKLLRLVSTLLPELLFHHYRKFFRATQLKMPILSSNKQCRLSLRYGESVDMVWRRCRQHCWGELQHFLPNPNALVAISKGMRAVKLCTNKIFKFLTQVDLYNGRKALVVVVHSLYWFYKLSHKPFLVSYINFSFAFIFFFSSLSVSASVWQMQSWLYCWCPWSKSSAFCWN